MDKTLILHGYIRVKWDLNAQRSHSINISSLPLPLFSSSFNITSLFSVNMPTSPNPLPTRPLDFVNYVSILFPIPPTFLNRLILLNPSSSSPRAILVHLAYSSPSSFPAFISYFCLVYLWFLLFGNNLKLARTVEKITFLKL